MANSKKEYIVVKKGKAPISLEIVDGYPFKPDDTLFYQKCDSSSSRYVLTDRATGLSVTHDRTIEGLKNKYLNQYKAALQDVKVTKRYKSLVASFNELREAYETMYYKKHGTLEGLPE